MGADLAKACRVWRGLLRKISETTRENFCFMADLPGVEMILFGYLHLVFGNSENIEDNFVSEYVRQVDQISRQVIREKHRMEVFVWFQKLTGNRYFSNVSPAFNILPLVSEHFRKRHIDQR